VTYLCSYHSEDTHYRGRYDGHLDLCSYRSRVVVRRVIAWLIPRTQDSTTTGARCLSLRTPAHVGATYCLVIFCLVVSVAVFRVRDKTWLEKLFFPLGGIVGVTAYMMSIYAVGGWRSAAPCSFFTSLFLFSMARAYLHGSAVMPLEHRWTLRGWHSFRHCHTRP